MMLTIAGKHERKWWKTSCDEVKEKQIVSVRLHSKLTYEEGKEEQIVCVRPLLVHL